MSKLNMIFQVIIFILSVTAIILSQSITTIITIAMAYFIIITRGEE